MGLLIERVKEPEKDYSAEKAECERRGHPPILPGYRHYIERTMDYICPKCKTPYSIPMTNAEVIEMLKEMHGNSWRAKIRDYKVH